MSGPYRPGYPGNGGNQGNQPVSFKTDINRKKTKKWVAAKSYSYDGDDWGDDDDDDEEVEEEEEVPPLPDTSRLPSYATHQVSHTGPEPINTTASQPPVHVSNPSAESPPIQSPALVRPADIYKEIQEDNERTSFSQELTSNTALPEVPPPVQQDVRQNPVSQHTEEEARSPSPLVIPEVKRLSGFGQDFFGNTSSPAQAVQPSQSLEAPVADQGSLLHHNPSVGFNSVVHQAFDVAETPSSSTGNFSRSNSDSTSIISPIISPWKSETDKTPTITEDPTAEASAQELPANFKPGHRRDLSIPSPGNGPDRLPTVAHTEDSQSAEVVLPSSQDAPAIPEYDVPESSTAQEEAVSGEATPRPLSTVHDGVHHPELESISTGSEIKSPSEETHSRGPSPLRIPEEHSQDIPQIVPSLSTETSPQDMESDRLRREIMRSFSSDQLPAADPQPEAQNDRLGESNSQARQSTYLPSEYDSYWNDQQGIPPTSPLQLRPAAPPTEPSNLATNPEPLVNPPNESVANPTVSDSHPGLKKRFSWEASDDSEEEDVLEEPSETSQPVQTVPVAEASTSDSTDSVPHQETGDDALEGETDFTNRESLPEYSAGENEFVENVEKQPEEPQGELSYFPPIAEPPVSTHTETDSQTQSSQAPINEASLPSFRKIMEISSSSEKIRVFNETREQFASIDNGLSDWIRRSSESLPEHADIIQANGRLPGGAPTSGLPPKAKFPKLASLGNLSLPTQSSHSDGSSAGFSPTHARRPSGSPITGVMNRQNVEAKGKDLLHSAGVLGGKAGGAARGLFAKGKSKLRGADKGVSSKFRGERRRSWALSSEPDAQSSDLERVETEPVTLSPSSRYSLQGVPRIPSLRLSDSKSFKDYFEGEEAFSTSTSSRPFSLDSGPNLRSVTEEETVPSKPANAMFTLDSAVDALSSTEETHSTRDFSSDDISKQPSSTWGGRESMVDSNVSLESESHARTQEQTASTDSPSVVSSELPSPLQHQISHSQSQVSKLSEHSDPDGTITLSNPTAESAPPPKHVSMAPGDGSVLSPVSPPLPQDGRSAPAEYTKRGSLDSKVSDISEDETDGLREKLDEEGLYSESKKPSNSGSQVSDMTEDDDDDDDEDAALREKLDEAGYHSDPEKDAWQQFPRPPTASPGRDQSVHVVRMTRIQMNKIVSPNDENDTRRYSRFSFESEGNTLAEARLVNGYGRSDVPDESSQGDGLPSSEIPVTMGEDAPDDAPPPFSGPETSYRDEKKPQREEEVPAHAHNNSTLVRSKRNRHSSRSSGAKSPPGYRQIHSPPPPSIDATSKNDRLQELRTNRDSVASSSVSSMSNPTANPNIPRTAISPEPHIARPPVHKRFSQDSQKKIHRTDTEGTDKQGKSLWANGRLLGRGHARAISDSLSGSINGVTSLVSGKRDKDSLGSRDSMVVQAASSRNDLRLDPSPLNQGSETASAASDHSSQPRLSMQLRNKMKVMGKKARDFTASNPAVEREVETKPVEKKKEKKTDGKKGALTRFSGMFNREQGGEQRTERNTASPIIHQQQLDGYPRNAGPPPQIFQPASYKQPTNNQEIPPSATPYGQHPSMVGHQKALPPPPEGYYAPAHQQTKNPVQNPSYQNYSHPYSAAAYQPAPAPAPAPLPVPTQQYSPNKPQPSYYSRASTQPRTSVSSRSYNVASSPINSTARTSSTSSDVEESRTRARDLRMRSRSPRASPVRSVTRNSENINYSDPIYNLGKFNAVTETARIGDQSLPFPITLPEDLSNGQLSPRTPVKPESSYFANGRSAPNSGLGLHKAKQPTPLSMSATMAAAAAASSASPPPSPPNQNPKTINPGTDTYQNREVITINTTPVELPVPNDDSDDEIVMSSTAYPGQEWQPAGFEQWMPY